MDAFFLVLLNPVDDDENSGDAYFKHLVLDRIRMLMGRTPELGKLLFESGQDWSVEVPDLVSLDESSSSASDEAIVISDSD